MRVDYQRPILFVVYDNNPKDQAYAQHVARFLIDHRGYVLDKRTAQYKEYGYFALYTDRTNEQMREDYDFAVKKYQPDNVVELHPCETVEARAESRNLQHSLKLMQRYIDRHTYAIKVLSEAFNATSELVVREVLKGAINKREQELEIMQKMVDRYLVHYADLLD